MILLLLIILSIYMYPICMKFWPKYILYLKKLRADDLLEKRKLLIPFSFTSCNDLNRKLEQRCFEQCMSMGKALLLYWVVVLIKCFFPGDSILVTDTKILNSNLNLVK